MNIRNRVLATLGAAALVATMSTGVLASAPPTGSDSANVDVQVKVIDGSTVTVSIGETTSFTDVTYNLTTAQESDGALTVTVKDNRGTARGWNVTLGATNFLRTVNTGIGSDIAISNLALTPTTPTRVSGVGTIPTATSTIPQVSTTQSQLWNAPADKGDGEFAVVLNGALNIPAGQLVDTYKSTITVEVTAAP